MTASHGNASREPATVSPVSNRSTMQITILDGNAFNPGDLDWSVFENFGHVTVYPRSTREEAIERGRNSEIILTNKVLFDATMFEHFPKLKYLGIFATGYNTIDVVTAGKRGITVTNIPSYSTESVVQLTFAHLLNLTFRLCEHTEAVKNGDWCRSPDFCFWRGSLMELFGKTFGVIGFGNIGKRVAAIAYSFGMKVLLHGPRLFLETPGLYAPYQAVSLDTLLRESDVVSLHCPLTTETREMIGADELAKMKPTAFLLNLSRGPLVNESALANALNRGQVAGAGLDVLSQEPPEETNPLLNAKNCHITPHFAWGTFAARLRLMSVAAENLRGFLEGTPQNVVTVFKTEHAKDADE